AAKFAYETTKCIRPFKITLADNRYNRDNELYAQWVSCYKAGISSYIVSHQFITTSDANGPMYNEEIRSSAVQVNWDSYSCVVDRSAHVWSPVKGWKDGAKTHDLETFSPLVGNVNGKYPVDAMKAKCRAEWDFRVSQLTTVSKNDLKAAGNTLVAHCAGNFKADNDFYEIYQQSFGRHLCALNNILNKYKDLGLSVTQQFSGAVQTRHELFNPDDLTSQFYYISCGLNDFKDKDNQVPVIRITQSPTNDKPGTFNLSAAASYDPDGDVLRYRWVLTAMPDTLEAKSKTYVLYQKLSIAQVLAMILDLGGDWQVAVEVNDNKDASEMDIILAYSRKILWIAHSDNDIFLQRYHYVDAAKGIDTTFNLEVSSNPVGVYLNYNDAMEPVDSIAYTPATPGSCYSIQKNSVQPENAKGAYDGLYGSSIFTTGIRYNSIPGPLVLKSSSNRPGKACFEISVLDPDITDFVYSTVSCLYGARKHRPEALQGFFTVKQWIDKSAWLNPDGLGFVEYKKENATAYHECPDWMEEQAARVIQGHAILREYVGRIVVAAKNENENRDRYGHYIPGTRFICLNPYINDIRWNLPACNAYGFYGKNCLENTALHEAFHCFYYQTIHKGVYVNKDKDGLPGEPYSGMFAYLLDDNTNYCGAKLLGSLLEINADDPHYDYLGDGEYDYASGETKFFYSKGSLADVQGKVCPSVTIPVPRPLPMPAYRVFIEEVFVQTGVNSMKMLYRPKYGSDFSYVVEKKKSGVQNIIITFNSAIFNDNLQRWIFDKNNKNASLFVEFSATMPFHPEEYDASRIEPATYVDIENEG
ncbi:MAG: hypothetical protein NTU54_04575, partial [Candidatus Omnitrophica bacterium]|nr:hypothetical protein [Candidatus Omnitrophota bacterium]